MIVTVKSVVRHVWGQTHEKWGRAFANILLGKVREYSEYVNDDQKRQFLMLFEEGKDGSGNN